MEGWVNTKALQYYVKLRNKGIRNRRNKQGGNVK